jgi:hypothetical protein
MDQPLGLVSRGPRFTESDRRADIKTKVSDARDKAIEKVEQLLDALVNLRKATRASELATRRALKKAMEGADVASAVAQSQPADTRQTMNDALNAAEKARHDARLMVFAAGLEEGMSIGELGRMFGFSRQLASRYAKEARSLTEGA